MEERRELPEQGDVRRIESEDSGQYPLFAVEHRRHSGPLPDPDTLARYKEVDPTFPERIMRMAENDQAGRLGALDRVTRAEAYSVKVGMTSMVVVSVISVALAAWLLLAGIPAGAALLALPVLTAIPKFIAALRGRSPDGDE